MKTITEIAQAETLGTAMGKGRSEAALVTTDDVLRGYDRAVRRFVDLGGFSGKQRDTFWTAYEKACVQEAPALWTDAMLDQPMGVSRGF